MKDLVVGIVGLGLMGGSIARALRGRVGSIVGRDPVSERAARWRGWIDSGSLADCSVVILAAPLPSLPEVARTVAGEVAPRCLLMDIGSVKAPLARVYRQLGRPVVSGHPMAGTERRGLEHSDPRLFRGHPFLLVPVRAQAPHRRLAERLVRCLGARPVWLRNFAEHDRLVARVSHLPHLSAFALHALGTRFRNAAGPSFRDATRVAASPVQTVSEWLHANRKEVRIALGRYLRILRRLDRSLRGGPGRFEALLRRLQEGVDVSRPAQE